MYALPDVGVSNSLLETQFYKAVGAVAAQDGDDRVIYNTTTGDLYYDADGTGSLEAVRFAVLGSATHPDLAASDFVIVA